MSPVFDETKYRELLERLEISVISICDIFSTKLNVRIDAEFYQKEYIHSERLLSNMPCEKFSCFCYSIKKGIFDLSPEEYDKEGIPFIRTSEIKSPIIDFSTTVFLNEQTHQNNYKTELFPYDIVFTKIGAYIGDVAILPPNYGRYNFSQNVAGAKIKQHENSPYILAFFKSYIGQNMIKRTIMLSGQGKLEVNDIRNYKIPVFPKNLIKRIERLFNASIAKSSKSSLKYQEAERILLSELNLINWQADDKSVATKTFAETQNAKRLDAEYYQPKYDEYSSKIEAYAHGTTTVGAQFSQNKQQATFTRAKYNYIEIGDINVGNGEASFNSLCADELPANAKYLVSQGDVLISKVRPYRGAVSIIDFEPENLIASGAFTILQETGKIKKEVLATLLRAPLYRDWMLKWNVGSSYPVIKDEDILNLIIPQIPTGIQDNISAKVQESFALRKESKRLFDLAKRTVELAIEQGEDAAMKLLENIPNA